MVAPLLAQVFWTGLTLIRPEYAELSIDPYRPLWYRLAVVAITAAVLFIWYALLRRRIGPAALAIGGLGWLALIGVALAFYAPGGSYLAAIPALAGALMGMLAILFRGGAGAVLAVIVGGAVAVLVLLPTGGAVLPRAGHDAGRRRRPASPPCWAWRCCRSSTCCTRRPADSRAWRRGGPAGVAGLPALVAVLAVVAFAGDPACSWTASTPPARRPPS